MYLAIRNLTCASLGLLLILSGQVRRRKNELLNSKLITPIYFHNPNKRLFQRCIRWLSRNGFHFISTDELINVLREDIRFPQGAVWLSLDDGFQQNLTNVFPITIRDKIPITIFIPCGVVAGDGLFYWLRSSTLVQDNKRHDEKKSLRHAMTAEEVIELSKSSGITIGSHTVNHAVLSRLTESEVRGELEESKVILERWTGAPIKAFSFPEARFKGSERIVLQELNYRLAVTTEPAFISKTTDPYFVPRFNVGDDIPFSEALCRMVGVWPIIKISHLLRKLPFSNKRIRSLQANINS